MRVGFMVLPAMIVALAGCQTGQKTGNKNPSAAFDRCVAHVVTWDITAKHEAAAFIGVPAARMPDIFCRRLVDAMASGRITRADMHRLRTNQSSDVWMVIKGK